MKFSTCIINLNNFTLIFRTISLIGIIRVSQHHMHAVISANYSISELFSESMSYVLAVLQ